ncbi:MAG: ribonuclease domain-containing protein [Hydrogenophaga sp.]|uniref:ribonuclease domain-containing protein n=1 Tax=Hydrogenophaga sp. TaxID=1904254 RepID=UPI0025BE33F9|nr:ribonuclease domain-containing protein [Hydrogenophaga sp.]MDO9505973.1 ribonuclease domain-containing protein [Hydrogenophaga sp.]MDP3204475.1 ribonuclease domain-containing protein [Hydrogenophaga sp.]MDP3629145.1 ribonuclease domain-containing protein [Hydrogenophaga sp.]
MDLKRIRVRIGNVKVVASLALALVLTASLGTFLVQARTPANQATPDANGVSLTESSLPVQGRKVMEQIRQGGPFRYEKDGTVFGNRERLLPSQRRGFYREYTVPTPGLSHRGARRIVCGGLQPKAPDACYYTEDHYSSFKLIVQ